MLDFDSVLNMSNEAIFLVLLVLVAPWITGLINQQHWSSNAKLLTMVAVSIVASALFLFVTDRWDDGNLVRLSLVILMGATIVYRLFRRPVTEWEAKTTIHERV